ncbi:hypothetical protein KIPB_003774 [Kipferlia bialata]|uniref:Uncharacterized protein n=1 Tax=Kipferlia bialata TaxID=797122 RepID=A0A9K3CW03_9EUKA|nr:hypothetical protein KIPB_000804 [Kipferlia bialata]GIQ82609.1 hypothetical protein KIPB_003774 [Kipferlia bialata]|eukprot:g804.t1
MVISSEQLALYGAVTAKPGQVEESYRRTQWGRRLRHRLGAGVAVPVPENKTMAPVPERNGALIPRVLCGMDTASAWHDGRIGTVPAEHTGATPIAHPHIVRVVSQMQESKGIPPGQFRRLYPLHRRIYKDKGSEGYTVAPKEIPYKTHHGVSVCELSNVVVRDTIEKEAHRQARVQSGPTVDSEEADIWRMPRTLSALGSDMRVRTKPDFAIPSDPTRLHGQWCRWSARRPTPVSEYHKDRAHAASELLIGARVAVQVEGRVLRVVMTDEWKAQLAKVRKGISKHDAFLASIHDAV